MFILFTIDPKALPGHFNLRLEKKKKKCNHCKAKQEIFGHHAIPDTSLYSAKPKIWPMRERDAPFIPSNIDPEERPSAAVNRTPLFERARSWDVFPVDIVYIRKTCKVGKARMRCHCEQLCVTLDSRYI